MSKSDQKSMTLTLRSLSRLLGYPDQTLCAALGEVKTALHTEHVLSPNSLQGLDALIDWLNLPAMEVQIAYVHTFDQGRSTSLHLFEHVHGDSRDRGPAMIDLLHTYEAAGLFLAQDQLPDHLPVLLEFASTQPPRQAREFLAETVHILESIYSALHARGSPYAAVLAAVVELAGGQVRAQDGVTRSAALLTSEESLDQSWQEPEAFDGCSSILTAIKQPGHTSSPAQYATEQPIQIVRRPANALGPAVHAEGA
jgi:nitrate reductase delta subunit